VDIRIDDPGVSRQHAEITLGTDVTLRDLGSTNGTLVNGRMVSAVVLADGARIQLGTTTVTYRAR
jgi:pSer/pThr/pTyr-binding forkhead associated (FHA) protein